VSAWGVRAEEKGVAGGGCDRYTVFANRGSKRSVFASRGFESGIFPTSNFAGGCYGEASVTIAQGSG
jgi:hypothetical protein